jgi:hypothetical protein
MFDRAKWSIEESVAESLDNEGTADYCPPITAAFLCKSGTIYGFNEDTIFFYDESEGIDNLGGCWHYDQMHKCREVSFDSISEFLEVEIKYIIKKIPKKADNKDIAMALVYLSKGFQEERILSDKIIDNEGIGEDEVLRLLYPHAEGLENLWLIGEEKEYNVSGMWYFEVIEPLGAAFAILEKIPTFEDAINLVLQMIQKWMDIAEAEMGKNSRQLLCAYKSAF